MAPTASGYQYSHPDPGEEICITGIAGYFPKTNSVEDFRENLFAKVDLISDLRKIWKVQDRNWSFRTGKINNHNKFDAEFFRQNYKDVHQTAPTSRLLLERTYEAIIDAGVNPSELRNTKTGVFIGTCYVDIEGPLMWNRMPINENAIMGCARSNLAVNLSEYFGLKGPNYSIDTACSSSMYIVDHAYKAIRDGRCDAAIVGSGNLFIHYEEYYEVFPRYGLTSPEGKCKCFDESADGYVRSEAVVVCLLQKTKDARRIHAQLIHVKTNCDGFKQQNISFPSAEMQAQVFRDVYEESEVSPDTLEYLECHCTGTVAGDREELIAVDEVICSQRSKPLLIGSVKSNMGHSESVSGLCSLAKICIAYNSGFIAPNIHLIKPRQEIACIAEGRVQIVTDKMPWNCGYVAINNFGFGGANSHCLIRNAAKAKVNNGLPNDNLPRAVCVSGRTRSAVAKILRHLQSNSLDAEEIRLWHSIYAKDIPGHGYRGYTIINYLNGKTVSFGEEIEKTSSAPHTICFWYSRVDKQCIHSFLRLMEIPTIHAAIQRCQKVLTSKGLNLINLFKEYDSKKNKVTDTVVNVVIQIAMTNLLRKTNITPDVIIGEDLGELCCAYANGGMTETETILAAYSMTEKDESRMNNNLTINGNNQNQQVDVPHKLLQELDSYTVIIGVTSQNNLSINKNITYVPLFQDTDDIVEYFFRSWCRLYMLGLNPDMSHLYPNVEFPVSQGTSFLSHLVEWEHREDWCVEHLLQNKLDIVERKVRITLDHQKTEYLRGHCVNGRVLYPGSGYLVLAWETLARTHFLTSVDNLSVVFEDIRWQRATVIPDNGGVEFTVTLHKITGEFEITENDVTVTTGRIYAKKNVGRNFEKMPDAPADDNDDIRMSAVDFYKEIRMRGYGHKELFQGILDMNVIGTHSRVAWINNWVVFLDNLFQTYLLSKRSRNLYVPTRLEMLSLDTDLHFANIIKESDHYIKVFSDIMINVIRSPGIEVRGLHFDVIARTIKYNSPLLETYEFVPYIAKNKYTEETVLQIYVQIVLENLNVFLFKSIEIIHKKLIKGLREPLTRIIDKIFKGTPRIEYELNIISDFTLEMEPHINVVNSGEEFEDKTTALVVGEDILAKVETIEKYRSYLLKDGFIITRERNLPETKCDTYDIIATYDVGTEYLILLKIKSTTKTKKCFKIDATDDEFLWVDKLKSEDIQDEGKNKVILYSQNEYISGLIGLVKCLRREPNGGMFSAFSILDPHAPPFDMSLEFYREQIDKNLVMNVFQDGQWGSYRHLLINEVDLIKPVPHAYVNVGNIGDVSSLQWYEGPIVDDDSNGNVIHVYSSAMNFRDVLVATGRMHSHDEYLDELKKDCLLGVETAGRTVNGSRVMCLTHKGFSNKVFCSEGLLLPVPDEWTSEEAASVTVAYATVYVGFMNDDHKLYYKFKKKELERAKEGAEFEPDI